MDLCFQDICIKIGEKEIIKDLGGVVRKGEMLAVMGPSGAGKSTLLSALCNRISLHEGKITLNGEVLSKQIARKIKFVHQQDMFFPTLTLKETLTFAAILTLPDKMPRWLKIRRVDEIITLLELEKCTDTIIGDLMIPGLSGGERKRASIGCEIITDPAILVLDEPTSGLDYSIASKLVTTLQKYASCGGGKTVIASIHQPSSRIFHSFSNILLLADGQVAYYGSTSTILEHFNAVGLHCALQYNPADFIIEELRASATNQENLIALAKSHRRHLPSISHDIHTQGKDNRAFTEVSLNGKTERKGLTMSIRAQSLVDTDIHIKEYQTLNSRWPSGFITQYTTLTQRLFKNSRPHMFSKPVIFMRLTICVFTMAMWWQQPRTEEHVPDHLGVIFFYVTFWGFDSIVDGATTFQQGRGVIDRERAAGMYRLSSYWLAKQTSELPPLICMPTLFVIAVYWSAGLVPIAWCFILHLLNFLLFVLCLRSIGMFVGVLLLDFAAAISTVIVCMVVFLLVGGYYKKNLEYLDFFKYLSPLTYVYEGDVVLDVKYGSHFKCADRNVTLYATCLEPNTTTVPGTEIVEQMGLKTPVWVAPLFLFGVMLAFNYSSYLLLRFLRRPRMQR